MNPSLICLVALSLSVVRVDSGKKITYNSISTDQFKKLGFPGAEELGEMFAYLLDKDPYRSAPEQSRALYPEAKTVEQWAASTPLLEKLKQ